MTILPWIEDDHFNPNYLVRDLHKMPKHGDKPEWRHNQHYWLHICQLNGDSIYLIPEHGFYLCTFVEN
jgi:hypothetical protein